MRRRHAEEALGYAGTLDDVTRALSLVFALALVTAACSNATSISTTSTVPYAATTAPWSPTADACVAPGGEGTCEIDGYPDRPYEVFIPGSYDPAKAMPLVIAFHGGGGSATTGVAMSCRGNDIDDQSCLHRLGDREGFVTVYPSGTGFFPIKRLRTWNAGGGSDGWNCVSGKACRSEIDDLAYVDRLLEDLRSWLNVDRDRIYATGLSNGAAFSHRLACQRAGTFAAIAAVAGSNQFSTTERCDPKAPVAILQVHGTEDPCWTYETSDAACINAGGKKLGARESVEGWADVLACTKAPTDTNLPDVANDDTATVATRWSGCDGGVDVLLLSVRGGGHTWPNGNPALSEDRVGRVTHDWGNEVLWGFLSGYSKRQQNG